MIDYKISRRAETDIAEAAAWYRVKSATLAGRFLRDVDQTILQIRDRPMSFPRGTQRSRRARCAVFRHGVFFRIERGVTAVIMSVYHPSRDPTKWRER